MDLISLTALVFAVIAFLVAFAQALLQYLTSDVREKVMSGALGGWSRFSSTSWNYRSWRINVKFAELDLSANNILAAMSDSSHQGIAGWMQKNGIKGETVTLDDKQWKDLSLWDLWAEHTAIIKIPKKKHKKKKRRRVLAWKDLTWLQKASWIVFLIRLGRHRRPRIARAGWANLLSVFTIQASKTLLHQQRPADHIPGAIDVPYQGIDLKELALLCYVLNMKKIEIDVLENTINAKSTYTRISTLEIPGLGQVVTFDGDTNGLRRQISRAGASTLRTTLEIADGTIYFGNIPMHPNLHDGHRILLAMRQNWTSQEWKSYQMHIVHANVTQGIYKVVDHNIRLQAQEFRDHFANEKLPWEEFWGKRLGRPSPNMINTLAFQQFHSIWSGVPLQHTLAPYQEHLQHKRLAWFEDVIQQTAAGAADRSLRLEASLELDTHMMKRSIPWLLEKSDFLLATDDGADWEGLRTWTLHPARPLLDYWDPDITNKICDSSIPLCVPSRVFNLLRTGDVEASRKDLSDAYLYNAGFGYYTIDAALYLSLIIVDCRIQTEWCKCEATGPLSSYYRSIRGRTPRQASAPLVPRQDIQDGAGSRHHQLDVPSFDFISSELADFLALWLTICASVDPTDKKASVQAIFDVVLNDWQNDQSLCVLDLPAENPLANKNELPKNGQPLTRAGFCQWIEVGPRRSVLRELLPLLQLRTFLLHLSFLCHSDSTAVSNIGGLDRGKLRLI